MPEFLVEQYVPRGDAQMVERRTRRARLAAEELTRHGTRVRFLRSIFVPEDETCFFLYEAASFDDVRNAVAASNLPCDRIAEAMGESKGEES